MPRITKDRSVKSGLPPGTLIHIGERSDREIRITIAEYTDKTYEEKAISSLKESFYYMEPKALTWIDVEGLHEVELIQKFGDTQGLHPLVLEDIVNTNQRPKLEDYGDYLYIVLKMLRDRGEPGVGMEQISLILGPRFVISFQEGLRGDLFGPVRERLRNGKGRLRSMGADYLVYTLIDMIVDSYFTSLERLGDAISELEDEVVREPGPETTRKIHQMKRDMIQLRRVAWPLREVLSALERRESTLVTAPVAIYLRDVYDHTVQVIDAVEAYRDIVSGLLDIYLTSLSNRMNEAIKFLTVIGTIFIPLTFIAGVYGMNFQFMPELHMRWGYFVVLGLMAVVALSMLAIFRRKRWL